jgi:hypothetical protein
LKRIGGQLEGATIEASAAAATESARKRRPATSPSH